MEYTFTLKYQLAPDDQDHDALVERLGAADCEDALVGVGQPGRIALEFTRESDTAMGAVLSALSNVKQALPTAKFIEALPDFAGLTDVADMVGMSRQNLRKLMLGYADSFPLPVHEGSAAVWHLADVLQWLQGKGSYQVDEALLKVAEVVKELNLARESHQIEPKVRREIEALVA